MWKMDMSNIAANFSVDSSAKAGNSRDRTGFLGDAATLLDFAWPAARLNEALAELAQRSGLADVGGGASDATMPASDAIPQDSVGLDRWFVAEGRRLGIEVESVETTSSRLDEMLGSCAPAIVRCRANGSAHFFLLLAAKGKFVWLLTPSLRRRRCRAADLRTLIVAPHEFPIRHGIDRLMDAAQVTRRRRDRVRRLLVDERLARQPISGCWLLRLPASATAMRQVRQSRIVPRVVAMLALFAAAYAIEILGWKVIGGAALDGRLDFGWLAGWTLVVLTLVPIGLAGAWCGRILTLDIGRMVKSRLLLGSLQIDINLARRMGAGQMLARVMESQAFESLAIGGGLVAAVTLLELAFAAWVLGMGAGGLLHLLLLTLWVIGGTLLAIRFHAGLRRWTASRLSLTHNLVERMIGHRTTLAQEDPARRDAAADQAARDYLSVSSDIDRRAAPYLAGVSGTWMFAGIAGLAPAFVSGTASATDLAIGLGGVLMAARALGGVIAGLSSIARALVAREAIAPFFQAASGDTAPARPPSLARNVAERGNAPFIDAEGLAYRYDDVSAPVLESVNLKIRYGDRLLIEGASGSGKSTLASLLVGMRRPNSGLLLMDGLDRETLGAGWHDRAVSAPQFHDNHILNGPLAFNLLMGRNWPPSEDDLAEAKQVCEELGLGNLLRRMPAGLMQMVGETGWQLSHGERSRVFLARALLQEASLTVVDESFAALDPETLAQCLECTFRRAKTLVVIAHP
jgi:ATP-binding cassette subfamily B protein